MNILLLGSGGREHALAWKMAASPLVQKLYCAPGNAGIAEEAECVALDPGDHAAVIAFCKDKAVDLVVVGPALRRYRGCARGRGHQGLRALESCRSARGVQGLHQGHLPRQQHPDRGL
jgi:phosphoribosylamine--glycine ligase